MSANRRRPIDTVECRSTRYFRCERADDLRSHRQASPSWEDETRTMRSSAVWRDRLAEGEKPPGVAQLCKAPRGLPRTMPVRWMGRIFVLRRRGIRRGTPYTQGERQGLSVRDRIDDGSV
ncbi:unnamed protein product [Lasius platythorax]|uniref:Uncharacterized protein n=1 Tax=Lasius platythorax TaxID=488582 RepID=A0AAV2NX24_9HYME